MKKTSTKQSRINKALQEIKKNLPGYCTICGRKATDGAHLLPRSLFPEYVADSRNVVPLCRECHQQFDDNANFRTLQTKLFNQASEIDELGAKRYFRR